MSDSTLRVWISIAADNTIKLVMITIFLLSRLLTHHPAHTTAGRALVAILADDTMAGAYLTRSQY